MAGIGYTDAIKTVAKFIGDSQYMAHQEVMKQLGVDPAIKFQGITSRDDFNKYDFV